MQQERMLLGILAEAGMLLSGTGGEVSSGQHFRFREKRALQEAKRRGHRREAHRTINSD
jgi:hypothetical protein